MTLSLTEIFAIANEREDLLLGELADAEQRTVTASDALGFRQTLSHVRDVKNIVAKMRQIKRRVRIR